MEQLSLLQKIYQYGETLSSEELNQIVQYLNSSIEAINTLIARNNNINEGHCEMRYKVSAQQPEAPESGTDGKSNGWSDTYTKPDTANGEITWMTLSFFNGEGIYGAWSTPVCITWGSVQGQKGPKGDSGLKGSFKSRVFKRQNSRPDTPTGGTYDNPIPSEEGWTDGIPTGKAIIWSSVCTFYGNGLSSGWSVPAPESDNDTLDIEFSPNAVQPEPPTGDTPFTNHESEGWYDPSSNNFNTVGTMIWRAERKVSNGEYNGDWTITRIVGEKGDRGDSGLTGGHYEFRYNNFKPSEQSSAPTKPETGSNGTTNGWTTSQETLTETQIKEGYATWMTQCYQNEASTYGVWTDPIRITGANGYDGEDGIDIEFVYTRREDVWANPTPPPTTQTDDWPTNGNNHSATVNGVTWYDNPQGVTEVLMYEYVSQRQKVDDVWSAYSTPVVWSKWGEKGMDGDGYEYIYKRFTTPQTFTKANTEDATSENPEDWPAVQEREYKGTTGWSDDPQGIDETNKYEYVSFRQRIDEVWGKFNKPTLWSGIPGGKEEFRYANNTTKPNKPSAGSSGIDNTWKVTQSELTEAQIKSGYKTWMTQCFKTDSGTYGTWTDPIRITGANGLDGEDGSDIEFIYTTSNSAAAPSAPTASGTGNSKTFTDDDWYGVDNNGVIWTDNPSGVTSSLKYEYISIREKPAGKNQSWGSYSTPVIWSKWGEKGMDGDGFEYIYKHFGSIPTWGENNSNPAYWDASQSNEYTGPNDSGWTDDPQGVDSSNKYEYVSVRKKVNGTWGKFSTPAMWAKFAIDGINGNHIEFRYKNAATRPETPSGSSPSGWSATASTPSSGEYTWMSQSTVNGAGTYGAWSTPIRITGNKGEDGADGSDIEFIYTRNNTGSAPATPTSVNTDDHIPTNWTDNPQGVTSSMMYEFVSTREKAKGSSTWGNFSTPVVWAKYGEKGQDGDGYEYIYKHFSSEQTWGNDNNNPNFWAANQNREYYGPTNYTWSDDPTGVDSTNKYEYVSVRQRVDGTWGKFSTPVLWSNYAEAEAAVEGPQGKLGPMSYLAGIWNASTTYTKSETANPIVYRDTRDEYYYIKEIGSPTVGVAPETSDSGWIQAENYNMVFTDILFVNTFAKLGSFIVNNDWLISKHGIMYDTGGTEHIITSSNTWSTYNQNNAYTKFEPGYPTSSHSGVDNFCPYLAIDARTGESYFQKVHIKGEINATSGTFNGDVYANQFRAGNENGFNITVNSDSIDFNYGGSKQAWFTTKKYEMNTNGEIVDSGNDASQGFYLYIISPKNGNLVTIDFDNLKFSEITNDNLVQIPTHTTTIKTLTVGNGGLVSLSNRTIYYQNQDANGNSITNRYFWNSECTNEITSGSLGNNCYVLSKTGFCIMSETVTSGSSTVGNKALRDVEIYKPAYMPPNTGMIVGNGSSVYIVKKNNNYYAVQCTNTTSQTVYNSGVYYNASASSPLSSMAENLKLSSDNSGVSAYLGEYSSSSGIPTHTTGAKLSIFTVSGSSTPMTKVDYNV